MQEGIYFDPLGSITVTFDDTGYQLTLPKMRQWRYFSRRIEEMSDAAKVRLGELANAAAEAATAYEAEATPLTKTALDQANEELQEFASTPFYETSSQLVREIFEQLGDKPLPDDMDDWPTWLAADVTIPAQILQHWRTAPKVSGATAPKT